MILLQEILSTPSASSVILKGDVLRFVFCEKQGSCKILKTTDVISLAYIRSCSKSDLFSVKVIRSNDGIVLGGGTEHFTLWCSIEQGFIACLLYPDVLDVWEQAPGDAHLDKQPQTSKLPLRGYAQPFSLSSSLCCPVDSLLCCHPSSVQVLVGIQGKHSAFCIFAIWRCQKLFAWTLIFGKTCPSRLIFKADS